VLATLEQLAQGQPPANVREAVSGWAGTAWWVEADGEGDRLKAERGIMERIRAEEGSEELFVARNGSLRPVGTREEAARWLEERGFRVAPEERDPPREFGTSARDEYARAIEAWQRRLEHSGEGTPQGSYWENVVPVEPPPDTAR